MALKMTNREVNGVSVVALDGRIVLGEESNALLLKLKIWKSEDYRMSIFDAAALGIGYFNQLRPTCLATEMKSFDSESGTKGLASPQGQNLTTPKR